MDDSSLNVTSSLGNKVAQQYLNIKTVFRTRKWRLILKLIYSALRMHMLNKQPLRFADIAVGYTCNLNCIHCSAVHLKKSEAALALEDYKMLAAGLKKLGVVHIDFTGGEPTIFENLEEIIPLFNPRATYLSISTNGIGPLTRQTLMKYKKAGVDALVISIDSLNDNCHDEFRGRKGSLQETLQTIKTGRETGYSVVVCACVHHQNLYSKGFKALIDYTKENTLILNLALAVPAGNWSDLEYFRKYYMLNHDDKVYVREIIKNNTHVRFDFGINLKKWGCPAGHEKIYITPYGDVMPCPFMQITFGNLRKDTIANIRTRILAEKRVAGYFNQCLCAEDENFIYTYLSQTIGATFLPIPCEEVFGTQNSIKTS
jgi:MoaA/NifB/PqqE/SkfB family radical SAM enzyme